MTDLHAGISLQLGYPPLTLGVLGVLVPHEVLQGAMVGIYGEVAAYQVNAEVSHSLAQSPSFTVGDTP